MSLPTLEKWDRGDYRTPDGRWQIIQPRLMDNGLQRRWLIREREQLLGCHRWHALDDDYATLREAREALADELAAQIGSTVASEAPERRGRP